MNILEIENLNKKYKNTGFEIKDINMNLKQGFVMGLIGENGSGKTTIIKTIMNTLLKDSGSIKIFGKDNLEFEAEIKNRMGFVYDNPSYYPNFNCYQMKDVIAPFYSKWSDKKFDMYLDKFEINGYKEISDLSRGMKMKYSLALAFSHGAELIIMDEPTSGLDPTARREILNTIQNLVVDENVAFLISSHITTDLDKIADYITYIDNGEIKLSGSKEEILDKYKVIKGGLEDLESFEENIIIGIETSRIGFAGLVEEEKLKDLEGIEYVLEIPTIEDLMYYMGRK